MSEQGRRGAVRSERSASNMLDVIDHVAIAVEDISAAVSWYTEKFNCSVEYQDNTWAYLKFQNIHMALVSPTQHRSHVGFAVDNAEQYGPLTTHRDGTRSLYVTDPAGNAVELMDKNSLDASQSARKS